VKRLSLILALMLLVASCQKSEQAPLPQGTQTVRAILKPVPVSLKRRGTHGLYTLAGTLTAYAESTAVNLRAVEGREVTLQGVYEKNTDDVELPVFVVSKVTEQGDEEIRPWQIAVLGLSLQAPKSWKGSISGKVASFTSSGFTLLTIAGQKAAPPPSSAGLYGPLGLPAVSSSLPSDAELLVVGLRKGRAVLSQSGRQWLVLVEGAASDALTIEFSFGIRPDIPQEEQIAAYRKILKTVEFRAGTHASAQRSSAAFSRAAASGAASVKTSRAGGQGETCGGPAGVLCPKGFYCSITDLAANTGVCVQR
jgi:hypothetical protein